MNTFTHSPASVAATAVDVLVRRLNNAENVLQVLLKSAKTSGFSNPLIERRLGQLEELVMTIPGTYSTLLAEWEGKLAAFWKAYVEWGSVEEYPSRTEVDLVDLYGSKQKQQQQQPQQQFSVSQTSSTESMNISIAKKQDAIEKTEKITVTKMKQVSTPVDVSDTDKNNSADRYEDPPKSRPAIPQAAAHFEENRRPQYNVMTVNDSPSSQSDFSQQEFLQHSQASWDSAPTVASPTSSTSSQKPVHKVPQKPMSFSQSFVPPQPVKSVAFEQEELLDKGNTLGNDAFDDYIFANIGQNELDFSLPPAEFIVAKEKYRLARLAATSTSFSSFSPPFVPSSQPQPNKPLSQEAPSFTSRDSSLSRDQAPRRGQSTLQQEKQSGDGFWDGWVKGMSSTKRPTSIAGGGGDGSGRSSRNSSYNDESIAPPKQQQRQSMPPFTQEANGGGGSCNVSSTSNYGSSDNISKMIFKSSDAAHSQPMRPRQSMRPPPQRQPPQVSQETSYREAVNTPKYSQMDYDFDDWAAPPS